MSDLDVVFRPGLPGDARTIREIVHAAYARWVPVIGREPRPMQADYDLALREHEFDLAVIAGAEVGLIETVLRDGHLWIQNVAVLPAMQGKGLGQRLLGRAEDKARSAGRPELRLLTNGAFTENIALYERLGYRIDSEEPFGEGTTVFMSKRIG
jgi:GNAT superfamily N-acetyltransferase